MKRLVVCFVIMASVVIFSLWGIYQIQSLRKEFDQLILKSESLVLQRDMSGADKYLKDFKKEWNKKKDKISYVCNNNDLKEISFMISRLEFQVYNSYDDYFESCAVLREKLATLLETEIPDFEGIF